MYVLGRFPDRPAAYRFVAGRTSRVPRDLFDLPRCQTSVFATPKLETRVGVAERSALLRDETKRNGIAFVVYNIILYKCARVVAEDDNPAGSVDRTS